MAVIDAEGGTPRPEMAEYRSENGFVLFAAAIILLNADLAGRTGTTTFWRAKRSSSAGAVLPAPPVLLLLAPCEGRLCLPGGGFAGAGVCSEDGRGKSGVTISKSGSLGRVATSGYDEGTSTGFPSVTGLSRERLRECKGCGEATLKEFEVDKLALRPDRPSETLSDIAPASLVVANSLSETLEP